MGRAAVPEGGRKDPAIVEEVIGRIIHAVGSGDDVVTADGRRRTRTAAEGELAIPTMRIDLPERGFRIDIVECEDLRRAGRYVQRELLFEREPRFQRDCPFQGRLILRVGRPGECRVHPARPCWGLTAHRFDDVRFIQGSSINPAQPSINRQFHSRRGGDVLARPVDRRGLLLL